MDDSLPHSNTGPRAMARATGTQFAKRSSGQKKSPEPALHPATGREKPPWDYFRPGRSSLFPEILLGCQRSCSPAPEQRWRTSGRVEYPRQVLLDCPPGPLLPGSELDESSSITT